MTILNVINFLYLLVVLVSALPITAAPGCFRNPNFSYGPITYGHLTVPIHKIVVKTSTCLVMQASLVTTNTAFVTRGLSSGLDPLAVRQGMNSFIFPSHSLSQI
jgi:hypothetical protein